MFHFFQDEEANDCNKGAGDDVESDEEFISVDFTCGSMVWVKFSGWTNKIKEKTLKHNCKVFLGGREWLITVRMWRTHFLCLRIILGKLLSTTWCKI
jgi:hypothetical protein